MIVIRPIEAQDYDVWLTLWHAYIDFYEADVPEQVTQATWNRIIDQNGSITGDVAELNGEVIGFSHSVVHDATWTDTPNCYLEDLFVDSNVRGQGIGRALIDNLVSRCKIHNWSKLYWHTNEENLTARKLYDSYIEADGHVRYRLAFGK